MEPALLRAKLTYHLEKIVKGENKVIQDESKWPSALKNNDNIHRIASVNFASSEYNYFETVQAMESLEEDG